MRFITLPLTLLIAITLPFQQGDGPVYWDNLCDPDVPQEVIENLGQENRAEACAVFQDCLSQPAADAALCQLPVYAFFLTQCADTAAMCETKATFYTVALQQGKHDPRSLEIISLLTMETDQYAAALDNDLIEFLVTTAQTDYSYIDTTLYLAAGMVAEFSEQSEAALDIYHQAFQFGGDPFLYFRRGLIYGKLGYTDLAALDGFVLSQMAQSTPALESTVAVLTARYPLDESRLEDWLLYDDQDYGSGPRGELLLDLSLTPPQAVRLGFFQEDTVLFLSDEDRFGRVHSTVYHQTDDHTYTYQDYNRLQIITLVNDTGVRYASFEGFESSGNSRQWLAKAGMSDPRPAYPRCEGGARWRLRLGSHAYPHHRYVTEYPVGYDRPGGEPIVTVYDEIRVISEPVCLDGTAWWEVEPVFTQQQSPATYWIEETTATDSGSFQYQMRLTRRSSLDCEGALPPNLPVGLHAYTLSGVGSVPIYAEPVVSSDLLATTEVFIVVDGPVCADNTFWWHVAVNGVLGWLQGDDGSQYFALPSQIAEEWFLIP